MLCKTLTCGSSTKRNGSEDIPSPYPAGRSKRSIADLAMAEEEAGKGTWLRLQRETRIAKLRDNSIQSRAFG